MSTDPHRREVFLFVPHPPLPSLRWATALLCCALSVAAPFSESTLIEVIEGRAAPQSACPPRAEAEDTIEDEEPLLRQANLGEGRRQERKHARPLPLFPFVCASAFWIAPPLPRLPFCRPGSEHAFRNGCGSPLLC